MGSALGFSGRYLRWAQQTLMFGFQVQSVPEVHIHLCWILSTVHPFLIEIALELSQSKWFFPFEDLILFKNRLLLLIFLLFSFPDSHCQATDPYDRQYEEDAEMV